MGSSTAAGVGASKVAWASSLQATYAARSVRLINIARSWTVTYDGLPTASSTPAARPSPNPVDNVDAALANSPKLLLVAYPTNDTANDYSVEETVNNLLAIRAAAQARGTAVIIVSTQPRRLPAAQLARLALIDARLSSTVSPCFVAVREALAGPDGTLAARYDSGDHIHPNDAGHAVIHAGVVELIDSGRCVSL